LNWDYVSGEFAKPGAPTNLKGTVS